MPFPITSPRPVSGEPISSLWGGELHDLVKALGLDPKFIQTGTASNAAPGNSQAPTWVVTFPVPFDNTPTVFVSQSTISGVTWITSVGGLSPTQFTYGIRHNTNAAWTDVRVVAWLAIDLKYLRG